MTETRIYSQPLRFTTKTCRGEIHPRTQSHKSIRSRMPATDAALRWGSSTHHILAAIADNS